jgi:hypothetical protein
MIPTLYHYAQRKIKDQQKNQYPFLFQKDQKIKEKYLHDKKNEDQKDITLASLQHIPMHH